MAIDQEKGNQSGMGSRLVPFWSEWLCVISSVLMIFLSIYHYQVISDPDAYKNRFTLFAILLIALMTLFSFLIQLSRSIGFFGDGQVVRGMVAIFAAAGTFTSFLIAAWYDSPTFLFAT